MSSLSSSIIYENIENFELGPYWEKHRETLEKLSKSDMPSKSSMFYKEVIAHTNDETNLILKYGIINFSNNRKNFLRINVEMTSEFLIKNEEIIFSDGLEHAKRTMVSDENDIHERHKEWLKNLYEKHCLIK